MRLFCLGNSLTAGYPGYSPSIDGFSQGYGNYKSQYEYWIQKEYETYIEKNRSDLVKLNPKNFQIRNKGIPGENTSGLLNRINNEINEANPKSDYFIIIIGTNDLLWSNSITTILSNIKEIHKMCSRKAIKSIGGTIPPIRAEQSQIFYHEQKISLNKQLKGFFSKQSIPYVDLFDGMSDKNGNLKGEFAITDGIHFNVQGYEKMGKLIFHQTIKQILTTKHNPV